MLPSIRLQNVIFNSCLFPMIKLQEILLLVTASFTLNVSLSNFLMVKSANPQKPFITLHFSVKIVIMKAYVFSAGLKTNTSQLPCFVELNVTVLCDKHTTVA